MKNNNSIIVFFVLIVIVVGAVAIALLNDSIDWSTKYDPKGTQPYDLNATFQMMHKVSGRGAFHMVNAEDSLHDFLQEHSFEKNSNYVFIGGSYYPDSADTKALIDFIRSGNKAFIFIENTEQNLVFDSLFRYLAMEDEVSDADSADEEVLQDDAETADEEAAQLDSVESTGEVNTLHFDELDRMYFEKGLPNNFVFANSVKLDIVRYGRHDSISFPLTFIDDFEPVATHWNGFENFVYTCDSSTSEALGNATCFNKQIEKNEGILPMTNEFYSQSVNYMRVKCGAGELYVHAMPIVFTNYFMRNDTVFNYAQEVFSYMGNGDVIWDEDNRAYEYQPEMEESEESEKGPLEFILGEKYLRYAWFALLIATLLYILFGARRKQRVQLVYSKPENTSIEYAEVISQLFMQQKDHKKLVLLKMDLFLAFMRERWNVRTQNWADDEEAFFLLLSKKSGLDSGLFKSIFDEYRVISALSFVNTESMLKFHHQIEYIYNHCK